MADQPGWEILGTFYPHVGYDALLEGDFALIREITGMSIDEWERGADWSMVERGWAAVAFWHGNLELSRSEVIYAFERMPASNRRRVNFTQVEVDDASPPEKATSDDSSTTTVEQLEESSSSTRTPQPDTESTEVSSRASSTLNGSGHQPSDTGVTSHQPISAPATTSGA